MFQIALTNVLVTIFYILPGYVIRKMKIVREKELSMASGILIYIGTPFLIMSAFLDMEFSWKQAAQMGLFFIIAIMLQAVFMGILFLVLRKKTGDIRYRLLAVMSELGNVGFFGLPIVRALFPDNPEVGCYCSMYMMAMNTLVFTIGVYALTEDRKYISVRSAVFNPTVFGLVIGLPLFFFNAGSFLPTALLNGIRTLGNITAPLSMIILGIRLASVPLKEVFCEKMAYVAVALKLIAYPLFAFAVVYFLPLPFSFKACILVLSSAPSAAITLSLAEYHHAGEKTAASTLILSTLLCFLTIPVLTLLLG